MPIEHQGQPLLLINDPLDIIEGPIAMMPDPVVLLILQMADGQTTVGQIAEAAREQTGMIITADKIRHVVKELDEAGLLMSESFVAKWEARKSAFRDMATRPSAVFKSEDRLKLIRDLAEAMRGHKMGPDSPPSKLDLPGGALRAVLAPHIDYERGGQTYAWAYQAILEKSSADTFVILGTLHRPSLHPFIATRKTFETPFGNVEVDTEFLDEFEKDFEGELYEDEYQHLDEHTIELQVVYLKHLLKDRPFRIVPFLVGSMDQLFHLEEKVEPMDDGEVQSFVAALRKGLDARGDKALLVGGVDFAHCGPEFGDRQANDESVVKSVAEQDRAMLDAIESVDPTAFFDTFRGDLNERRVCSVAPIYCVLAAMQGKATGKTLKYHQANNAEKSCMVSFASVGFFDREPAKPKIILASR